MINLPKPPRLLIEDLSNDWLYASSSLATRSKDSSKQFEFLSALSNEESKEFSVFETRFKSFLYGGFSVQRISPRQLNGGGVDSLERRTLWLMLPEVGSLRLGYVSKRSDAGSQDDQSDFSETGTNVSDDYTAGESTIGDTTTDSKSTMNVRTMQQNPCSEIYLELTFSPSSTINRARQYERS